jgi:NAD(P) transhydrogenase
MAVVGAGVIGVEYACMFAALGTKVTLLDARHRVLEFVDREIAEALMYHMRDLGVTPRLGEEVTHVEADEDGVTAFTKSNKRIRAHVVLYAVGRQGATDELNLEAVGLQADSRGRLKVDERMRTEIPNVYAAGDVIGFPSLAGTSMEQGRVAACNACGIADERIPNLFPYGIYTIPEISFIGKTEEQLTEEGVPYEIGVAHYRELARANILGDMIGRLKILFHRETEELLGVHAIGEGACELVHIGQAVMLLGGTIRYFEEQVFNYPTLAEAYKVAALNGLSRLERFTRRLAA